MICCFFFNLFCVVLWACVCSRALFLQPAQFLRVPGPHLLGNLEQDLEWWVMCQKPVVDAPDIFTSVQTNSYSYRKYRKGNDSLNHLLWASTSLARKWGSSYAVYIYIAIKLQHVVVSLGGWYLLHTLAQSSKNNPFYTGAFHSAPYHRHLLGPSCIRKLAFVSSRITPTGDEYTAPDWKEDAAWPARLIRTARGLYPHLTASTPRVQGHIINHSFYLRGFRRNCPKHVRGGVHVWLCTHGSQTCSDSSFLCSLLQGQAWPWCLSSRSCLHSPWWDRPLELQLCRAPRSVS